MRTLSTQHRDGIDSRRLSHLTGRVAVVTGGSRGIGRGIVELLAERGAAVGFAFREREAPARDARGDHAAPVAAAPGPGSATSATQAAVSAFFKQVAAELGPVDILVNNAGITRDAHVMLLDARAGTK